MHVSDGQIDWVEIVLSGCDGDRGLIISEDERDEHCTVVRLILANDILKICEQLRR